MNKDCFYLAPGAQNFQSFSSSSPPEVASGCTRVVCISDTHNEHDSLSLPWGHILVHAGDVMTESGLRHIRQRTPNMPSAVKESGRVLVERFLKWLGEQPHPHKVFIGGNHDWVLEALGPQELKNMINKFAPDGSVIYLQHEEATAGPFKIYGSPYAHWGGHNDAFMCTDENIYENISKGTHVVITHTPAILPRSSDFREKKDLLKAMDDTGTLLSVSGHCHWAHGLYHSSKGNIPCVIASVCDSKWLSMRSLIVGPSGKRGDAEGDLARGGYNIRFPIIVCDIKVPGGPPAGAKWKIKSEVEKTKETEKKDKNKKEEKEKKEKKKEVKPRPSLLFFGPPTDVEAVTRLVPALQKHYDVTHFDDATEAIQEIRNRNNNFSACVAKLGSRGNLGINVVKALRERPNGHKTFVVIHSATACQSERTRKSLEPLVDLIVDHDSEDKMLKVLFQ